MSDGVVRVRVCLKCRSHATVEGMGEPFEVRTREELRKVLTEKGLLDNPTNGNGPNGVWALATASVGGLPESVARFDGCQRLLFPPAFPLPPEAQQAR